MPFQYVVQTWLSYPRMTCPLPVDHFVGLVFRALSVPYVTLSSIRPVPRPDGPRTAMRG